MGCIPNESWQTQRFPPPPQPPVQRHLDIAFALENLQLIADQELLERGGTWGFNMFQPSKMGKSESGEAEKFNHHDLWYLWDWYVIYEWFMNMYDCMIGKLVHN